MDFNWLCLVCEWCSHNILKLCARILQLYVLRHLKFVCRWLACGVFVLSICLTMNDVQLHCLGFTKQTHTIIVKYYSNTIKYAHFQNLSNPPVWLQIPSPHLFTGFDFVLCTIFSNKFNVADVGKYSKRCCNVYYLISKRKFSHSHAHTTARTPINTKLQVSTVKHNNVVVVDHIWMCQLVLCSDNDFMELGK